MQLTKAQQEKVPEALSAFGYKNKMAAPKLMKVVVSSGTGSGMKKDRERNNLVSDRLMRITGQKPTLRVAKMSVASFKIREGDPVGLTVTLRGARMNHFVDKLIHIALPRTRDFRGLSAGSFDEMGNYTIGIKDHTIFPETSEEDLKDVFGLAITFVTTAKTKEEAEAFLRLLGLPIKTA